MRTTKQGRDKLIKLWETPIPNEAKSFREIRKSILATIVILCNEIDCLEGLLQSSGKFSEEEYKEYLQAQEEAEREELQLGN